MAYLPVPTIKRLLSVWLPIRSGGIEAARRQLLPRVLPRMVSASRLHFCPLEHRTILHRQRDDFNPVALGQRLPGVLSPRHELQIHLDGDMAGGETQFGQQLRNRSAAGDLPRLAIEQDRHEFAGRFQSGCSNGSVLGVSNFVTWVGQWIPGGIGSCCPNEPAEASVHCSR